MDLHHEFTVPAEADVVWDVLLDLERVGGCFPGATVTEASDDGFAGTVKVKLGPIALVYAGSGTFLERDPSAHRAVIEAKGKDKRGNGTAGAMVTLQLSADGDATRVSVDTDLAITGKPAQFGRGVMQDVSDKLLGQFVACIESQFDPPEPAEPAVEARPDARSGCGRAESAASAASDTTANPAGGRRDRPRCRGPALGRQTVGTVCRGWACRRPDRLRDRPRPQLTSVGSDASRVQAARP